MGNAQRPGPVGLATIAAPRQVRNVTRIISPAARGVSVTTLGISALTDEEEDLLLDIGQISLDIVGIFEPTPFADTANAGISVARSDWFGAGISLVGIIPYVGDIAKAGKFPRYLKTIERAIVQAQKSAQFAHLLRPILIRLYCRLDSMPLTFLPASAIATLRKIRADIVGFIGAPARIARARNLIKALRKEVEDPDMVLDILEASMARGSGMGRAVPVDDFLADILVHLKNFDGKPTLRLTDEPMLASRASDTIGGKVVNAHTGDSLLASDMGRYLIPGDDLAKAADRNASAVSFDWNKMSALEIQEIPPRSILLEGKVAAQLGQSGGGQQLAHFGQLSTSGDIMKAQRSIVDGKARLMGGKLVGDQ